MANEILKRDENSAIVLGGITDDASQEIRMLRVDPITGRLLVSSTGGGGGGLAAVSHDASLSGSGTPASPLIVVGGGSATNITYYDTIADLKAVNVSTLTNSQIVATRGYYSVGDGGGTIYYYNSSSSATDDGGAVIQPTAGAGRYLIPKTQKLSIRQWGAKGDGTNDDRNAIQATCNYGVSVGGADIIFPTGDFRLVGGYPIIIGNYNNFIGEGGKVWVSLPTGYVNPFSWTATEAYTLTNQLNSAGNLVSQNMVSYLGYSNTPWNGKGQVFLSGQYSTIRNMWIDGGWGTTNAPSGVVPITGMIPSSNTLYSSREEQTFYAIFQNSSDMKYIGNTIVNAPGQSITLGSRVEMIGNTFTEYGDHAAYYGQASSDVSMIGNKITGKRMDSGSLDFTANNSSPSVATFTTTIAHGLTSGTKLFVNTTNTIPAGLTAGTTYYVATTNLTATTFELGTVAGVGTVITTSTGAGTQTYYTINYVFAVVREAIKIRDVKDSKVVGNYIYVPFGAAFSIVSQGSAVVSQNLDGLVISNNEVYCKNFGTINSVRDSADLINGGAYLNNVLISSNKVICTGYFISTGYANIAKVAWRSNTANTGLACNNFKIAGNEVQFIPTSTGVQLMLLGGNPDYQTPWTNFSIEDNTFDAITTVNLGIAWIDLQGTSSDLTIKKNRFSCNYAAQLMLTTNAAQNVNITGPHTRGNIEISENSGTNLFNWISDDDAYFNNYAAGSTYSYGTVQFPDNQATQRVTMTITSPTIASPATFTTTGSHGFVAGSTVKFSSYGTLPTGVVNTTTYYVIATGLTATAFQVSLSLAGTAVNTTGVQNGTHLVTTPNVTVTNGANALVTTITTNNLAVNDTVQFSTDGGLGTLPTGITAGTTYYVIASGLTTTTFRFSTTKGGTAVTTSTLYTGYIIFKKYYTRVIQELVKLNSFLYSNNSTTTGGIPTVTITNNSPALCTTVSAHGLVANDAVSFTTTGGLPTGLTAGTTYYVMSVGLTATDFQVSTSTGDVGVVSTSSAGSGTHSVATPAWSIYSRPTCKLTLRNNVNNATIVFPGNIESTYLTYFSGNKLMNAYSINAYGNQNLTTTGGIINYLLGPTSTFIDTAAVSWVPLTTGYSYLIPTGTVNGVNTVFVFTTIPSIIVVDNGRIISQTSKDGTVNWTTRTVTLIVAPNNDIFGY